MLAAARRASYGANPVVVVVGLTGGIGSGKSSVADMFRARGATIVDADRIAREVVELGSSALLAIAQVFGADVLNTDGTLDRRELGRRVFGNDVERQKLNRIVHPEVARLTVERIQRAIEDGAPLVINDVPLLYENGLESRVGQVIVVNVSPEVQRARIRGRDDLTDEEIEARIGSQMPLAEKVARADFVIDNDGSLEETARQVDAIYRQLTENAS